MQNSRRLRSDKSVAEILTCPFASEIKKDILSWAHGQECAVVSGGAQKTRNYDIPQTHGLKKLFTWMQGNLTEISNSLSWDSGSLYNLPEQNGKRNFKIDQHWLLSYPLGSWVEPHNHFPHALSFGYYVNVPEKSSPIVIDYHKVEVKEGQLVVFMSYKTHWVPPTPVPNRILIAGDIVYLSRFMDKISKPKKFTLESKGFSL